MIMGKMIMGKGLGEAWGKGLGEEGLGRQDP
jgi:hypothetical protein